MRNTHLAMGIASAVAVTRPDTVPKCLVAIMGGVIGGLLCDIDLFGNGYKSRKFFERFIAVKITAIILLIDFVFKMGICQFILERDRQFLTAGGILFGVLCLFGIRSAHRTFTHSITAMLLFSLAFWLIYPPIVYSFMIGFLSHVILDLLNKKKITLFYPKDFRFCFGLCYADGIINQLLLYVGILLSVLLIVVGLFF